MKYLIGVDIGGTKISVVLGTLGGRILDKKVLSTQVGRKSKQSIQELITTIQTLLIRHRIRKDLAGIGIGVPGPVDPKKERIERSPNLPSWEKIPIRSILHSKFKCPVYLENDANAAALGEKYFGVGRKAKNLVYLTVSTGIGSGIILNGELVRGISGAAGEIGHTTVEINGEKCLCGKKGCLETYSSGTAIAKFMKRALKSGKKSNILKFANSIDQINGKHVSEASNSGDRLAIEIRRRAADYLGTAIGNLINLINPDCIILGGGVIEEPKHFWVPMMKAVNREVYPNIPKRYKITRTRLGKKVGDYGALAVALDRLKK